MVSTEYGLYAVHKAVVLFVAIYYIQKNKYFYINPPLFPLFVASLKHIEAYLRAEQKKADILWYNLLNGKLNIWIEISMNFFSNVSIGSGNVLVPNRQHTITMTQFTVSDAKWSH